MRYVTAAQGKCDSICIGRQGENKVVTVQFDVSGWQEMYGSGSFSLLHQRSNDLEAYPCVITSDTNMVSWVITSTDVYYVGNGRVQLLYVVDDKIAKSAIFTTVTLQSLNAGDSPDPEPEWVMDVINAGLDSEAYAIGERNGEPVDVDDPAYHNNAKYYKEQAENVVESIPPDYSELAEEVAEQSEKIDGLKTALPDLAMNYADYGSDWSGTDNSATITKTGNVIKFTGTHTATYHYVSLLGNQLYASSSNSINTIPSDAFSLVLPKGKYAFRLKVLSDGVGTGYNYLQILTNNDGTKKIVCWVGKPSNVKGTIVSTPFISDGTPMAVVMQLTGALSGLTFEIEIKQLCSTPAEDVRNGDFTNIAPYIKRWTKGYVTTNGSVGAQTATKEIISPYLTFYKKYWTGLIWIDTQMLGSGDVYPMIGFWNNTTWISRSTPTANFVAVQGDKSIFTFGIAIPTNATRIRFSFRTYGDTDIKFSAFNGEHAYEFLMENPIYIENAVDYAKYIEEQIDPKNNIKPHIGVRSINHRGWHECPENTLVAYKQSKVHGFEAGECDVRFTSDNVPVLLHDASINRTARNSDGTELSSTVNIASITYEQALAYDFGIYKGSTYAGTKIPTLAEYCTLCRNIGLSPYIEVEAGFSASQHKIIADTVIASGVVDEVTFISSDDTALVNIQKYIPYARYGILPWTYDSSYLTLATNMFNGKSEIFLDINRSQITSEVVSACAEANVPIEAWTPDAEQILALDSYVSGFTSDADVASTVLYNSEIGT